MSEIEEPIIIGEHNCDREFVSLRCKNCERIIRVLSGTRDRTCPECAKELYREKFDRYFEIIKPYVSLGNLMFVTLTWQVVCRIL